jgi:hypothetical protein
MVSEAHASPRHSRAVMEETFGAPDEWATLSPLLTVRKVNYKVYSGLR